MTGVMPPDTCDEYEDEDGIMRLCFECDPEFNEADREEIRMNEAGARARKAGRVDEARKLEEAIFARWDAKWAALPERMKQEIDAALAKRPLVRHQD